MVLLYLLGFILSIRLCINSLIQWIFIEHLYVPGIISGTEEVRETKIGVMVPSLLELIGQGEGRH